MLWVPACLRHPQSGTRVHFADRGPGTTTDRCCERTRLLPRAARGQLRNVDATPDGKRIPLGSEERPPPESAKPGPTNRASHGQADRHGPPRGIIDSIGLSHSLDGRLAGARGATGSGCETTASREPAPFPSAYHAGPLATETAAYRLPVAALRAGSLHGLGNAAVHRADRPTPSSGSDALIKGWGRRNLGDPFGSNAGDEANDLAASIHFAGCSCEISLFEALGGAGAPAAACQ